MPSGGRTLVKRFTNAADSLAGQGRREVDPPAIGIPGARHPQAPRSDVGRRAKVGEPGLDEAAVRLVHVVDAYPQLTPETSTRPSSSRCSHTLASPTLSVAKSSLTPSTTRPTRSA